MSWEALGEGDFGWSPEARSRGLRLGRERKTGARSGRDIAGLESRSGLGTHSLIYHRQSSACQVRSSCHPNAVKGVSVCQSPISRHSLPSNSLPATFSSRNTRHPFLQRYCLAGSHRKPREKRKRGRRKMTGSSQERIERRATISLFMPSSSESNSDHVFSHFAYEERVRGEEVDVSQKRLPITLSPYHSIQLLPHLESRSLSQIHPPYPAGSLLSQTDIISLFPVVPRAYY